MNISTTINLQHFTGFYDSATPEQSAHPDVLDYDNVVDVINDYKVKCAQLKGTEQYHRRYQQGISVGRMKDLTLEKLKKIHTECPVEEVVDYHISESGKDYTLPFIRIFRLKGKTFSIDSYMKEVIKTIKDYPNAIAKIVLAKDPKTNEIPSLHLSHDVWHNQLKGLLANADKEYQDAIKLEFGNDSVGKSIVNDLFNQEQTKQEPIIEEKNPVKTIDIPKPKELKVVDIPLPKQSEAIVDTANITIDELAGYIEHQELIGNIFWFEQPYKNQKNPMIFTLFDVINSTEDKTLCQPILERLKKNQLVDFDIIDSEGNTLFAKILKLQNHDILGIAQDRKIKYHRMYDTIAKDIQDDSFIKELKECNFDFVYIDNAAKEKSFNKMDKIFSSLNSIFFSKEKSGKYVLKSILETKYESYILDFWKKYYNYIPSKSAKIVNEFITKNKL